MHAVHHTFPAWHHVAPPLCNACHLPLCGCHTLPLLDVHVEAIRGVDGGAGSHAHSLPRLQRKVKLLDQHRQGHHRLHQSKLVTHTLAGPTAEGDVLVVGVLLVGHGSIQGEALGEELLGLLPHRGRVVDVVDTDHHVLTHAHLVASGQGVRDHGAAQQHGGVRVQPHALVHAAHHVLEGLEVSHGGLRALAHHAVHLLLCLRHLVGVLDQQVQGPGQCRARGLVARHQHAQQVVTQLGGVDLLPGRNEEAQHRGICLVEVLLPRCTCRRHLLLVHHLLALPDEVVGGGADELHSGSSLALTGHELVK
mmetsp:Transcript_12539/g.27040  ORF Transcript_12539/g.27040 Transcript_12539/m.27040 type:complete len:308 (-) Transcript_12539:870-1793(-)